MPRKIKSGNELSWHPTLKQWYRSVPVDYSEELKPIKKRKYFGTGSGPSDKASYRLAMSKYNTHLQEMEMVRASRGIIDRLTRGEPSGTPIEQRVMMTSPYMYDKGLSEEEKNEREYQAQEY